MDETLRRTPLHEEHVRLGAKLVPFAGYEMPVQYPTGITAEHRAVREAAGLFDVSHMGEFVVSGPDALALIQKATVNDASAMEVGQAQYSAMCRPNGGIVDDLLVYRFADHWMIVVNASNRQKDWTWLQQQARGLKVRLEDRSDDIALLALQGPRARAIAAPLLDIDADSVGYYRFTEGRVAGRDALIAGTGYTGEDGFELYVRADDAVHVWRALLDAGAAQGLIPVGLGARDSLRLEMGYALYGNDLDEEHTPMEAGLGWITKLAKPDFVARDVLARQKEQGVERKLVGLELLERGFPRPGYEVLEDGRPVGVVTSGTVSPTLGTGVAMAWVPSRLSALDTRVEVSLRGKPTPARVVRPPFYKGGSIRRQT
jgi:aminomethyltransferase